MAIHQEEEEEQVELPEVTMEQLIEMRREKLVQKKILISSTASLLIEDPQKNVGQLWSYAIFAMVLVVSIHNWQCSYANVSEDS